MTTYALGSNGNVVPIPTISGPHSGIALPQGIAVDSRGDIYVANRNASVTEYAPGSNGDVPLIATISGSNTGLGTFQAGAALDSNWNIYVTTGNSVLVFAAGSNGNVAPIASTAGPHTGLFRAWGITVDSRGKSMLSTPPIAPYSTAKRALLSIPEAAMVTQRPSLPSVAPGPGLLAIPLSRSQWILVGTSTPLAAMWGWPNLPHAATVT